MSEDVLQGYVGTYQLSPQMSIEVSAESGQLYVQATGQARFPAYAESETRFRLRVVEAAFEFVLNEDGLVEAMSMEQGGRTMRATRVN